MSDLFHIEPYKHSAHRKHIDAWWEHHGHWKVPKAAIPEATSYMCFINDRPISFASIYLTNASCIFISWIVANPEFSHKEIYMSLDYMLPRMVAISNMGKAEIIISTSGSSGLTKLTNKHGFIGAGKHDLIIGKFKGG